MPAAFNDDHEQYAVVGMETQAHEVEQLQQRATEIQEDRSEDAPPFGDPFRGDFMGSES